MESNVVVLTQFEFVDSILFPNMVKQSYLKIILNFLKSLFLNSLSV